MSITRFLWAILAIGVLPLLSQEATSPTFHQTVKQKFIEGDPLWMSPILICFIIGLAIAIERILTLILNFPNPQKELQYVQDMLKDNKITELMDYTSRKKNYLTEMIYAGITELSSGMEAVEKSIEAKGRLIVSSMEAGIQWINLFIGIAPLLGFLGTVVGMVMAFDAIAKANTISPAIVAHGISVALLTTLAGLIVAIILQIMYNYILSRIDAITYELEKFAVELTAIFDKHVQNK